MGFSLKEDLCFIVSSNTNKIISDKIAMQLYKIVQGGEPAPLPQSITRNEPPFMTSPVTQAIYKQIGEKGGSYFETNYNEVLKQAGFDFEDDMILFGVGEKLKADTQWENALSLYKVYAKLFPNIVVAWNQMGRCYKQLGNSAKAKECFEKSLSIRPVNNPAKQLLEELK
jgi:tetratricopeptide (TPR) repeat protein